VTPQDPSPCSEPVPPAPVRNVEDEATGLPFLHSWQSVYAFVLGTFILWVLLLVVLTLNSR
jgi:hypothetical protein